MYEYVITAGEGTLIELGVTDADGLLEPELEDNQEMVIARCSWDCETGQ